MALLGAADDAARHLPQVLLARREQPERRPAEAGRVRQIAALAGDDVGARVARCAQKPQRERIGDRY